jgi:hypothetical protein
MLMWRVPRQSREGAQSQFKFNLYQIPMIRTRVPIGAIRWT